VPNLEDVCYELARIAEDKRHQGHYMSSIRLNLLLYCSQGCHLALYNEPLFENSFSSYANGPVVYKMPSEFQANFIRLGEKGNGLPKSVKSFLKNVYREFGEFSTWSLRERLRCQYTWHEDSGPIDMDDMKKYFKSQMC